MTRKSILALPLAVLAACSPDICTQEVDNHQSFEKILACGDAGTILSGAAVSCGVKACQGALSACTSADQASMQATATCQAALLGAYTGGCSAPALQAFEEQVNGCYTKGGPISVTCGEKQGSATLSCAGL